MSESETGTDVGPFKIEWDPDKAELVEHDHGVTFEPRCLVVCVQHPQAQVRVHRVIWESVHGPIPTGLEINHINGVKTDNRIDNLELVTSRENVRHSIATGLRSGGAACVHGHPYDDANTHVDRRGWRTCRECNRIRQRAA